MPRPLRLAFLTAAALTVAPLATAGAAPPIVQATANGNAFTGGLSFAPADVSVPVGGIVAWTNTDFLAPHTVTERHGLWNLTGGYGATPLNPAGFGPGTSARRSFEAGTHQFFCTVHPTTMRGSVAVPVDVSSARTTTLVRAKARRGHKRPKAVRKTIATITMRWDADPVAAGMAFDVQRRQPGRAWTTLADGTTAASSTFRTTPGRTWEIRARLRKADDPGAATDWSPAAAVTG